MAGVAPGWTGPPGNCLVRPITPQAMGEHHLGPFLPFPGTYPGFQGSKNGYFFAKSRPKWQGWLQAGPVHLESVRCAISHPKPWESITKGHFCHYPGARFLLRLLLLKNIDFQDVYYIILLIQVLLAKLRNISMVCPLRTELKSELLTTLKCQCIL